METCDLTISELETLDEEDLKAIGASLCLKVCQNDKRKYEIGTQVLQLCTEKLLKIFGPQDSIFIKDTIELLKDILLQMLPQNVKENTENLQLEKLQTWVKFCALFLSTCEEFTTNMCQILDLSLSTSQHIINFCCKWWQVVNLRSLLSATVALTHLSIDLLNKLLDEHQKLDDETVAADFTKLNNILCAMCSYCYPVELKTVMAIWKCLTRMVTMSSQFSIHKKFASGPIKTFLGKIGYWLNLITTKKMESKDQINSNLQIAKFLLRILKCIFIDFRENELPEMEYFFSIYLLNFSFPKALEGIHVNPLAITSVQEGFRELMELLYKHEQFNQLLLSSLKKNAPLNVVQDYLSVCVQDPDLPFLRNQTNTQTRLFEHVFSNVDIIVDECKYAEFLEYFAFIAVVNQEFYLFLRKKVSFEKNLLLLHASAETLFLYANVIDFEQLLKEFRCWRDDNDNFVVCSLQINGVYVQHLVQHYAKLCAKQIKKDALVLDLNPNMSMRVYRYYMTILPAYSNKAQCQDELLQETKKFLENKLVSNTISVKQYYKMSLNLQLLTHLVCSSASELVDSIQLLLVELLHQKQRFYVFENAAFNYLKKHMRIVIKSKHTEKILLALHNLKEMLSVSMLQYVFMCSQEANFKLQKMSEQVLNNFAKIPWYEILVKPTKTHLVNYEQNKDALLNLLNEASLLISPHVCEDSTTNGENYVQTNKRARLENTSQSTDIDSLLSEMLQNSSKLVSLQAAALDLNQRQMTTNIIDNLKELL